ncbi:MAG TPA: hypothetical protein VGM74_15090 [Burkholderiaceae bacterium]
MNTRSMPARLLSTATLGAAIISAFVVLPAHALTRQEVAAQTRAAVAAGQLTPAGENDGRALQAPRSASPLTHSAVRDEVVAARAAGTLAPAGEASEFVPSYAASLLTRAEVKADVIAASRAGELSGRGEELNIEANASQHAIAVARLEQHHGVFSQLFAKRRAAANATSGT